MINNDASLVSDPDGLRGDFSDFREPRYEAYIINYDYYFCAAFVLRTCSLHYNNMYLYDVQQISYNVLNDVRE